MTYDSSLFTISGSPKGHKTLVAEASDLGGTPSTSFISVKSVRTGQTVRFAFSRCDGDGDEIAGWRFEPIAVDRDTIPGAHRASVLIIND
jgi:hypothetical protein